MTGRGDLEDVFEAARVMVAQPETRFRDSGWVDGAAALRDIDEILFKIRRGQALDAERMTALFQTDGPLQRVSLMSGWSAEFVSLAGRFDDAVGRYTAERASEPPTAEAESSAVEPPPPPPRPKPAPWTSYVAAAIVVVFVLLVALLGTWVEAVNPFHGQRPGWACDASKGSYVCTHDAPAPISSQPDLGRALRPR